MTKSVAISGYYGYDNLGDEAILYAMIEMLKKESPSIDINVLSASPEITAKRYGVNAILRNDFLKIMKVLKKTDLFLSGGGSLLQDVTSLRSIPYYLALVKLANILGNKTAFYAQGIGPVNKSISKKLIKWVANDTNLITLRDKDSLNLLKNIGVKEELINLTVDPVYGLYANDFLNSKNSLLDFKKKSEEKLVAISLRPWEDNSYLKSVIKAVDYLYERKKIKFVILPMYLDQDLEISKKLKEKMKSPAYLWKKKLTPAEMISLFSNFDFFIGVRLHSLIFAAINGIPFIGISYDPKVDSFLKDLNLKSNLSTDNCDYNKFKTVIDEFWLKREDIKEILRKEMQKKKQAAFDNIRRVLQLI
ncbi:MAG: polysaccharide pyruvyl transferase CsaB [Candidatus Woesearchaeota archaeon]